MLLLQSQYDLVLSAYSLLELPSSYNRLETVLKLWNKTARILVLVERGNTTGFRVINEARDFILSLENNASHVLMPVSSILILLGSDLIDMSL